MRIFLLDKNDYSAFNQLAYSYGSVFNMIEWSNIFNNNLLRYGIYNDNNELIGGFFLYKEKRMGFSIYRTPPFTPQIGPFLKINAQNPVAVLGTWKKALSLMADFIDKLPYLIVTISLSKNLIDMQPFIWKNFKVNPGYTYILNLNTSIEDIWQGMSAARRRNINKCKKDDLYIKRTDDTMIIKSVMERLFTKKESKKINLIVNKILFEFSNNDNSFAFTTYKEDTPLATSFCIYDKNTAYYILGGYQRNNNHPGAGPLCIWEAIKHSKNLGLKYFDFEGSMIPEIEKYFRGFGGSLIPYFKISKAKLPLELALKFYKREIF